MQMPEQLSLNRDAVSLSKVYRYIRNLESTTRYQNRKLNILLVLVVGNLALTILVLIALLIP